ncbi:hypothetical protein HEN75_023105 [Escherichia coli]|nr:hypothetical protein [Escherichia coli]
MKMKYLFASMMFSLPVINIFLDMWFKESGIYQMILEREGVYRMERRLNFSLSYEQLLQIAEERISECNLDSKVTIYSRESGKASAILG